MRGAYLTDLHHTEAVAVVAVTSWQLGLAPHAELSYLAFLEPLVVVLHRIEAVAVAAGTGRQLGVVRHAELSCLGSLEPLMVQLCWMGRH